MTNKDERVRFTFRLPEDLMKRLQERAKEKGISVNAEILQILWAWLDKEKSK